MFLQFIYPLHDTYSFLNVFRYITFRMIYAAITAMILSFLFTPMLIAFLQERLLGQQVRVDGPQSHMAKAGTPTMGGIMILFGILFPTILWGDLMNRYVWLAIFSLTGFGLIGFWDDYLKIKKKDSSGLSVGMKMGLQVLVAAFVAVSLYMMPEFSTKISIPFMKDVTPDLGLFYIPFAILVIVGTSNAVNLTDGLDGLAIGPVIIVAITYTLVTYLCGHKKFAEYLLIPYISGAGELAIFSSAIIGAGLGFLWFNTYPASIFMGDVGSLSLGASLSLMALITKHEILLVLVGGVFVMETVSVIFQVASYKSRKKRIFLMAPIHHHFELKGWEEPKIIVRFWIISIILALIALSTLKLR